MKSTFKLTDSNIKRLPTPDAGYSITWDSDVAGFGVRITAADTRSFILNYRTRTGRARRYTIGSFPDWQTTAARGEARELRKQIDLGEDPLGTIKAGRAAPTVGDMCDRFIKEYLPRKRATTQKSYRQQIEAEIRPAFARLKVAEITFDDVDALHRKITKRAPYRANRVIATLSSMFTLAIKWRWRTDNPCKGIERNTEHKRRRYLSREELARLALALPKLRDQQSAAIIGFLLVTGARRGEVLAARWQDFDEGFQYWTKPGATTKQKTEHRIPLNDGARQLLLLVRQQVPKRAEWVFPAADDSHRKNVQEAWMVVCKAANISGARLHDLRHTFASVLASSGYNLPIIGDLLGHTQASTTHRYAHLFDDPLRQATERAGAILSGKPGPGILPLEDGRE